MTISLLTVFLVSLFVLIALIGITQKEQNRGQRFFAVSLRDWLDIKIGQTESWLVRIWSHFVKYILQLHWYYGMHSVLRAFLRFTVALYTYVENVFERNRTRTKRLRAEKRQSNQSGHLQQVAQHKKAIALTPAQQKKLRKKKLEERF